MKRKPEPTRSKRGEVPMRIHASVAKEVYRQGIIDFSLKAAQENAGLPDNSFARHWKTKGECVDALGHRELWEMTDRLKRDGYVSYRAVHVFIQSAVRYPELTMVRAARGFFSAALLDEEAPRTWWCGGKLLRKPCESERLFDSLVLSHLDTASRDVDRQEYEDALRSLLEGYCVLAAREQLKAGAERRTAEYFIEQAERAIKALQRGMLGRIKKRFVPPPIYSPDPRALEERLSRLTDSAASGT